MVCKGCGYNHSHIVYTRHISHDNITKRRRECLRCGLRFTTQERQKLSPHEELYYREIGK